MVADGQWRVWIWRWIAALQRELTEGGLTQRAAALVYCSLLSLAPLLAVSFSLLKAFGVHNQIQPFLLEMLAPLGNQAGEISSRIIGFVENVQVGVLGFVGLATLFYTVVSLLGQVEESFNHIWRIRQPRPWVRRFSDYLSVVLVGPVLLFAGVGITASMSSSALAQRLIALEPFGTAYYLAGLVLPYVLVSAAFAFGYLFIPNTKVGLKPAAIGGVAAGLGWKLSGSLFTRFVADSAEYSAIYSGFAVVLVFMIWIYLSWIIVLLGGAVAFHCQHPSYLRMGRRNLRL
ncbi:MAG: YihY/virulence factor BrkB family protein, partial [Methylococcaceae bacterium]|nr:YihY/virulence factor BrkB family protein [Methylococcaceae bacterium]